jgi:drug/metabolite transporter (DMT)-like permease
VIATDRRSYLRAYGAFALLALIWGFSYILIKVGVTAMPATVVVLLRLGSGAITMLVAFAMMRRSLFSPGFRERLPGFLLMALTSSAIPFIAITWGQYYISTGLASILNATTPLWTAILAWWVTPNERPSRINYLGVAAGLAGTAILIGPQLLQDPFRASALAGLAVLAGAVSYAVAALGQRRLLAGVDPRDSSLWQLIIASLVMLAVAAPALPSVHPDGRALGAVLLLGVVGTAFAYILYYYILNSLGGTRAASVTFVVPITAVFWGVFLFHERLTISVLAGMAVILFGIVLTSIPPRKSAPSAAAGDLAKSRSA